MPRCALLIDAMGTLVTLDPPAPRLRAELAAALGVSVTEAQARHALATEIAFYRAHMQEGRDPDTLAALRGQCARVLAQALPPDPRLTGASTSALTDVLLAALHFSAFPDAAGALRQARAAGQAVIVVSNWDVSLPEVLDRVGLGPLLDAVLTSAGEGAPKPSAVIFRRALARAGCAPGDALHVGDSLEEDVVGARAAGIPAVLLRRDGSPGPAGVPTVASLTEVARLDGTPTVKP
jgi:putative hydrolase of the HAD superfamily